MRDSLQIVAHGWIGNIQDWGFWDYKDWTSSAIYGDRLSLGRVWWSSWGDYFLNVWGGVRARDFLKQVIWVIFALMSGVVSARRNKVQSIIALSGQKLGLGISDEQGLLTNVCRRQRPLIATFLVRDERCDVLRVLRHSDRLRKKDLFLWHPLIVDLRYDCRRAIETTSYHNWLVSWSSSKIWLHPNILITSKKDLLQGLVFIWPYIFAHFYHIFLRSVANSVSLFCDQTFHFFLGCFEGGYEPSCVSAWHVQLTPPHSLFCFTFFLFFSWWGLFIYHGESGQSVVFL